MKPGKPVALNDDGTVTYTFTGQAVGVTLEVVADAHFPERVDPLTSSYFDVWRLLHDQGNHDFDCTCSRIEGVQHTEICLVTPIFAELCRTFGTVSAIRKPIVDEMLRVVVPYIDDEFDEDDMDDCVCDCEPCYDGKGHCGDDFTGCHEHG